MLLQYSKWLSSRYCKGPSPHFVRDGVKSMACICRVGLFHLNGIMQEGVALFSAQAGKNGGRKYCSDRSPSVFPVFFGGS